MLSRNIRTRLAAPAATGGGLANLPAVTPVMQCADVTSLTISGVTIRSATVVTTGAPTPYCEVRGTIAPANTIVVRLPVNGWTTGSANACSRTATRPHHK